MGKRKFNKDWLERTDSNNQLVSMWCEVNSDYDVKCKVCKAQLNGSVESMGFASLKQHSEGQKHRQLSCIDLSNEGKSKQQSLVSQYFMKKPEQSDHKPNEHETVNSETSSASSTVGKWTIPKQATKAEIIATLQHDAPFSQAENLGACYKEQFPDSQIAQHVSISSNKMSYLVGYGLGPYFTQQTVNDLVSGNSFFTLHFDQTVTAQTKKQMDLLIWYWSETDHEVKVKYLTTLMFGSATAMNVVKDN